MTLLFLPDLLQTSPV